VQYLSVVYDIVPLEMKRLHRRQESKGP